MMCNSHTVSNSLNGFRGQIRKRNIGSGSGNKIYTTIRVMLAEQPELAYSSESVLKCDTLAHAPPYTQRANRIMRVEEQPAPPLHLR